MSKFTLKFINESNQYDFFSLEIEFYNSNEHCDKKCSSEASSNSKNDLPYFWWRRNQESCQSEWRKISLNDNDKNVSTAQQQAKKFIEILVGENIISLKEDAITQDNDTTKETIYSINLQQDVFLKVKDAAHPLSSFGLSLGMMSLLTGLALVISIPTLPYIGLVIGAIGFLITLGSAANHIDKKYNNGRFFSCIREFTIFPEDRSPSLGVK